MAGATEAALSESLQDYLEAVYMLIQRDRVARMKEIAAMLGVGKSSATGAIQLLAGRGLVHYGRYQYVTLTEQGQTLGRYLVRRHGVLKRFLVDVLDVADAEAERVGCKMEHAIRGEVLDRFVQYMDFLERRPLADGSWAESFRRFRHGRTGRRRP
jgi:DtxR family transcriptional regulator, Mn-dependent transcriptional regulator